MAFIGEAALSVFFEALFGKISSSCSQLELIVNEKQVRKEIVSWESTLKTIHGVLADAEEKQMKNEGVKIWLAELRDLAYDVDDILDDFATQQAAALGRKKNQATTCTAPCCFAGLHPSSIMFNRKMMSTIREITSRLEALAKRRTDLQLREINDVGIRNRPSPTTSLVNEADVFGREDDKKKLVDLVLNDDDTVGVAVIPIVGMGGIGKTTLAQLVYNETKSHFDTHAWVCVSEEFDLINVTKIILQSVTRQSCDSNDLNSLQVKLKEELSGKKFLIVLDDIWNKSYEDWTKLRSPFVAGAQGSKIIVTTRDFGVSSLMKTAPDHFSLQKLPEGESLSLLAHHALGASDFSDHKSLKEIGLQIVNKCDGLPLAIKTVGGLLRDRRDRDAWKHIAESEIWDLPEDSSGIFPALKLSYYHLSSQLKQCFAYCSLIPKDYEFTVDEIVPLWMAEGFLHGAAGATTKRDIQSLGRRCFKELVSRSFFQESRSNKSYFVMHDLINDLARLIAGKVCFRMDGDEKMKSSQDIRHSSYIMGRMDNIRKLESFFGAKHMRTFLPFWTFSTARISYLSKNVLTDLLPRLKCLRVLSLKRYCITEIPAFIGNLKHLRYLDFSYTEIKGLPNSLCTLYNLETLLLRCCVKLEKLPSGMENLGNLCCLDIIGAKSIKEMPSGIGNLTNLQILSIFVVGQGDGLNISEIGSLSNLKCKLSIMELQNVNDAQFAKEAKLSSKSELDHLELEWSKDFNANLRKKEVEREVLNLLRPHEELKALAMKNYAGISFPAWIKDPSFRSLHSLRFEGCRNCTSLPAVGRLPLLKHLYFRGLSSIISVGSEFYGENWANAFPLLETLHFQDMPEWKEWKPCDCEDDERGKSFQCLRELIIRNCPKLMETLPNGLHSLEKLVIKGCGELFVPISNLPMLCELEIDGCKEVKVWSYNDLWSIKKISLSKFTLLCAGKEMMLSECIMKVEDLLIDSDKGCEELASSSSSSAWQASAKPKWGWLDLAPLRSLRHLSIRKISQQVVCIGAAMPMSTEGEGAELSQLIIPCNIEDMSIEDCRGLERLSKALNNLSSLRELKITECPKLVSLSTDCLPPTLKKLNIERCGNLQYVFDDNNGETTTNSSSINFRSTISLQLESLVLYHCKALKSISSASSRCWLPTGLKSLWITECHGLEELVAQENETEFGDNTNCCLLQLIYIFKCKNMKRLPRGLDKLTRLQQIRINFCPNLVCFPESGLPTTVRTVMLQGCEKLEALPNNLHSLELQELGIWTCPKLKYDDSFSFPTGDEEGGLRSNLTTLWMEGEPKMSKAVMDCWGLHLHTFTSLRDLKINGGECEDMVSFPPMNMKLPPCLTQLEIESFKNVRKLSSNAFENLTSLQSLRVGNCPKLKSLPKSFQNLTSLQELSIYDCPKLKSLPKMEMLLQLHVYNCPELKKWCQRGYHRNRNNKLRILQQQQQQCFSNVAHIPNVEIQVKIVDVKLTLIESS